MVQRSCCILLSKNDLHGKLTGSVAKWIKCLTKYPEANGSKFTGVNFYLFSKSRIEIAHIGK